MLVCNWMSREVVTIEHNQSMQDALDLMKTHSIRMLPVMKRQRLAGVVTDRDIKRASASDATTLDIHELNYLIAKIKVADIMTPDPICVPWDYTIEECAELLLRHKISGVPVVDHDGRLQGVITQSDIFKALLALTGIGSQGVQFGLLVEDRPGSIMEVTNLMRAAGGRMVSILSTYEGVASGLRKVYIRVFGLDRDQLDWIRASLPAGARLLYFVDHRENRRQIVDASPAAQTAA
jgi:acetoin utilization protein AcuB